MSRNRLDPLTLVLMGKGLAVSLKPVNCLTPWRGTPSPSSPPFDAAQVAENRRLYPDLFADDGGP